MTTDDDLVAFPGVAIDPEVTVQFLPGDRVIINAPPKWWPTLLARIKWCWANKRLRPIIYTVVRYGPFTESY